MIFISTNPQEKRNVKNQERLISREREIKWCVTEIMPPQQGEKRLQVLRKQRAAIRKPAYDLESSENTYICNTMVILQEAPDEYLDNTTDWKRGKWSTTEDVLTKIASHEFGSKPYWWSMPAKIRRQWRFIYAPLTKLTKKFPQGNRYERGVSDKTNIAHTQGARTKPQAVQYGNGLEDRERKYQRCQIMHIERIKPPGKKPTVTLGRKIGRRIFLA